jgi:hypothetical protein
VLMNDLVVADSMSARPRLDGVPGAFLVLQVESDSCRRGRGYHESEPAIGRFQALPAGTLVGVDKVTAFEERPVHSIGFSAR